MFVRIAVLYGCLWFGFLQASAWAYTEQKEFTAVVTDIRSCQAEIGLIDRSTNEFLCVHDKPWGLALQALSKLKGQDVKIKGKVEGDTDHGLRTVRIERLNGQKLRDPNSHPFATALMIGAMGVQGAAAGMQKNPVLQQQQIAQIQAEQAAYQRQQQQQAQQAQAQVAQALQQQQMIQAMQAAYQQQQASGAQAQKIANRGLNSGGGGRLPDGCSWPSDFDLIRDSKMLNVLQNEDFAQNLLAGNMPTDQQISIGEQGLNQLEGTLPSLRDTIAAISSPTVTHFNFKFNYDSTCANSSDKSAIVAAECQYVNTQNAIYAMNGSLQIMDCMAGRQVRPSIGPPSDQEVAEDEKQELTYPAYRPPQPTVPTHADPTPPAPVAPPCRHPGCITH